MKTRIQRWGHSLALRLPKAVAIEAGLAENAEVEVAFVDGQITIVPISTPSYTLEELLAAITDDNIHSEQDFGEAVGDEAW